MLPILPLLLLQLVAAALSVGNSATRPTETIKITTGRETKHGEQVSIDTFSVEKSYDRHITSFDLLPAPRPQGVPRSAPLPPSHSNREETPNSCPSIDRRYLEDRRPLKSQEWVAPSVPGEETVAPSAAPKRSKTPKPSVWVAPSVPGEETVAPTIFSGNKHSGGGSSDSEGTTPVDTKQGYSGASSEGLGMLWYASGLFLCGSLLLVWHLKRRYFGTGAEASYGTTSTLPPRSFGTSDGGDGAEFAFPAQRGGYELVSQLEVVDDSADEISA